MTSDVSRSHQTATLICRVTQSVSGGKSASFCITRRLLLVPGEWQRGEGGIYIRPFLLLGVCKSSAMRPQLGNTWQLWPQLPTCSKHKPTHTNTMMHRTSCKRSRWKRRLQWELLYVCTLFQPECCTCANNALNVHKLLSHALMCTDTFIDKHRRRK